MSGCQARLLTLLSREYCHLCCEMEARVKAEIAGHEVAIEVIDVDRDPALEARWGELVPVLLAGEREICHYHLDRAALAAWLASAS